jgi:hypothetical protein
MRTTLFIGIAWFGWIAEAYTKVQVSHFPAYFVVIAFMFCFWQDLNELFLSFRK